MWAAVRGVYNVGSHAIHVIDTGAGHAIKVGGCVCVRHRWGLVRCGQP